MAEIAGGSQRAMLYRGGKMARIGPLNAKPLLASAAGINNSGEVVGVEADQSGTERAFLYSRGKLAVPQPLRGFTQCEALAINDMGHIVGFCQRGDRGPQRAFLLKGNQLTLLPLLSGTANVAEAINNRDQIVGQADVKVGGNVVQHAALWDGGKMLDLGTEIPDAVSNARGINSLGDVVGGASRPSSTASSGTEHITFLIHSRKFFRLGGLLPKNSGWELVEANGINDRGEIVGQGRFRGGQYGFLMKPATEPR
jgi:probable HAF family extracellular repeat protein